ncbi:MAG: 2-phosphotransferase [Flavisolibacter sp.]|jgi:putative RNA 2'-phosphotransferase|nr:2-phosphotransferase [Flavisolibacter sp.]
MKAPSKQTSKLISYWLRHNPEDAGFTMDEFGWISIEQLLQALHCRNLEIELQDLLLLNNSFDKVRWEVDASSNRIRATHGHSVAVTLEDKIKHPPEILYHGTSVRSVLKISEQGLLSMNRQFVHLSETEETAISVGKRHGKPIIIEIETEYLVKNGWVFFQTSDNVWLTTPIPTQYLRFRPWFSIENIDSHFINELKREIGNRRLHFLYQHLNNLKAIWKSSASDDTLFQDQETGICYMVHLTYTKREQDVDRWPNIEKYKSIEEWIEKGLWNDQQSFYGLK